MNQIIKMKNRKLTKHGNSWHMSINKPYIDNGDLDPDLIYDVELKIVSHKPKEGQESEKDMSWTCFEHANKYNSYNNILGVVVSC